MKQIMILIFTTLLIAFSCKSTKTKSIKKSDTNTVLEERIPKNWSGTYRGIIPCADCIGIKYEITLNEDMSYTLSRQHLEKSKEIDRQSGTFQWSETGSGIVVKTKSLRYEANRYIFKENKLIKLDIKGKMIGGELAENYVLVKGNDEILGKTWRLIEIRGKKIDSDQFLEKAPYFKLEENDQRVVGNGGCNTFVGRYNYAGNRLSFKDLTSTKMACRNLELENLLLQILGSVDNYTVRGEVLSLNRARMATLLKFEYDYFY